MATEDGALGAEEAELATKVAMEEGDRAPRTCLKMLRDAIPIPNVSLVILSIVTVCSLVGALVSAYRADLRFCVGPPEIP